MFGVASLTKLLQIKFRPERPTMPSPKDASRGDISLVDGTSLFDTTEALADHLDQPKVTLDYTKLKDVLNQERNACGWRPTDRTFAFLALDPNSEGQRRFRDMLEHNNYVILEEHYRDAFVSLPAGRTLSEASSKPITSLASHLAYTAGLLARYDHPHILLVTHSFELFRPLEDLARRVQDGGGRVGLAYFSSFLDFRWKRVGLLDGKTLVEFMDLEKYGRQLVGVDLVSSGRQAESPPRTGFPEI